MGGVPSAGKEGSSFSALRFVPVDFSCGEGEWDANFLRATTAGLGGVDRVDCASGVPERLPDAISVFSLAARLFVDATASA